MPKKVLLIDDDPLVGGTVLTILKRHGYQVEAVLSGSEALERAAEESYDLIISDIRMPGMNGIQAVEALQTLHRQTGRVCGFMFITGYAEEHAPENTIRIGVTDILMKPLDAQEFLISVEKNSRVQISDV
jgi:two-component system response regulator YesN